MKQILNQRYTYKIKSSYLERNKWNIKIKDKGQAIKDRFLVGVNDSQGFRFIRELTNTEYIKSENKINEIKRKIKNNKNSKELKNLYNELYNAKTEEHICNVVFNSKKQYDKACEKGFIINDIKYTLLLGTTGGIKNNTAMFVDETIYKSLMEKIYNGFDKSVPMIPSKLMSYMALVFSSSTPVTNTNKILVVRDVETNFKSNVTRIKFNDEKGVPDLSLVEDADITVNACDGCGLITPELADIWVKDLQEDYKITSFCCRNSWTKGILTRFDFKKYCKEVIKQEIVEDVWGEKHNINDVDIILNESMLKCWKGYKSIHDYIENCDKNGYTFAVTKTSPKELERKRTLNYQYLQCLNLSDEDINNLIEQDINNIKDILELDYRKTLLFGKGTELNDKNVWTNTEDDYYIKTLMINPNCIHDDYVKYRIRKTIDKRIKTLKTGKITVDGNYQIAIGEPVIQLESMFGLEPKGLLKANEYYSEYFREKGIKVLGCFRSPMSCKSNARKFNVSYNEEAIKWYGDLLNIIIFNAWDTSMMALNGMDFDGDIDFLTSNKTLINAIYDVPSIECIGKSGNKIPYITKEHFIKCIYDSFGNKVGGVTNVGSGGYAVISNFEEGTPEYNELEYRIQCIQYYQQECIDSAKNGIPPKPIPNYWINHRDDNVKESEFLQRTLIDKKPYYFIYIYNDIYKEYNDYIKKSNSNCRRRFKCSVEELIKKENKTEQEEEFVMWYLKKLPVNCSPCIVNKIAWIVENNFTNKPVIKNKDFDYSCYLSDNTEIATKEQIREIKKRFEEYKLNKTNQSKTSTGKEETLTEGKDRDDIIKDELNEIVPDRQVLLNTLIDLSYNKSVISKWLVWLVVGDLILENMLDNNDRKINYPVKDRYGNIEYDGYLFSMKELTIDKVVVE